MKTTGLICTGKSSLQNATKLLHLCPYTTGVVHKLNGTDDGARLNMVNWLSSWSA